MISNAVIMYGEGEPPRGWVVPPVVLYVAAPGQRSDGQSDKATFVRNLKAVSRRACLDRVEARMVLPSDTTAPSMGGVRPGLIWLAGQARRVPMPRLLYVARFSDLAFDRSGFAETLQVLFDADISVRVCEGLITAADRSLEEFRGSSDALVRAPSKRADQLISARTMAKRGNRGGTRTRPTMTGEA